MRSSSRTLAAALAATFAIGALAFLAPPARAAPPTIVIVAPQDGAVVGNGSAVFVVFRVTDFNPTDPGGVGKLPSPNEGHVEVFVDGARVAVLAELTVALPLGSGPHTIPLRLVQSDGSSLDPDVRATTQVYIKPATVVYILEAVNAGIILVLSAVLVIEVRRARAPSKPP